MKKEDFNLEEEDIYKLLNNIKIEESEFDDMDEEVQKLQKERIKKNLNKRIESDTSERKGKSRFKVLKVSCVAVGVCFVSLIGLGMVSPAFAQDIPVVNSIVQTISKLYGDNTNYSSYSQMINKSVTDNGVTITINDVVVDDSKLIIGYIIKSEEKINDLEVFGLGKFLSINGEQRDSFGSFAGKYEDDYTYIGSAEFNMDSLENIENVNVDINITELSTDINGNWDFAFSVSKDELVNKSTVFTPKCKVDFADNIVTVDKVVLSPIDTTIFFSGIGKNLKSKTFEYTYWIAYDDKGVELKGKGIGGGRFSSNGEFKSQASYINVKDIPKYITIIPCKLIPTGGAGESIDMETGKVTPLTIGETIDPGEDSKVIDIQDQITYPIELSQGKMGKLIIKEIKTENDKTIVKFTAEGKSPSLQSSELRVKDAEGKELDFSNYEVIKDETKFNEYTMKIKSLNLENRFTIFTTTFDNWEIREDLKFNIPLNK